MPDYAYCETITAGSTTPWHVRELTAKGKRLSGGADTRALCGRQVSWDLNIDMEPNGADRRCCKLCLEILQQREATDA